MSRGLVPFLALLLPVALVGIVKHAERRHWSEMLAESAAVETRLRAVPRERESVAGETTDGRAWEHYDVALASIRARDPDERDAGQFAQCIAVDEATARDLRVRWVEDWSAELAQVRRGVRARDIDPRLDWDAGLTISSPRFKDIRLLTNLCLAAGVEHLDAGRPGAAAESFLEALQFGHDLLDHPLAIVAVMGCAGVAPQPLLDLLAERGLDDFDAASLDALDAGLARLDATWPRQMTSLEAELILFVHHLRLVETSTGGLDTKAMFGEDRWTWRYLGSTRAGLSDGVRTALELAGRLGSDPTRVPRAALDALAGEVERHPNPVVRVFWSAPMRGTLDARRDAAIRLRSLRHALAVARGRAAAPVDDPFGLSSVVSEVDGQVVVNTPRRSGRDPIEVRVRR